MLIAYMPHLDLQVIGLATNCGYHITFRLQCCFYINCTQI